jgi:hypothetical protein
MCQKEQMKHQNVLIWSERLITYREDWWLGSSLWAAPATPVLACCLAWRFRAWCGELRTCFGLRWECCCRIWDKNEGEVPPLLTPQCRCMEPHMRPCLGWVAQPWWFVCHLLFLAIWNSIVLRWHYFFFIISFWTSVQITSLIYRIPFDMGHY